MQHNVHTITTTTKMITTTEFLTCFKFNSKFPLFAKKVTFSDNLKINEIYLLCLHLIIRYCKDWSKAGDPSAVIYVY